MDSDSERPRGQSVIPTADVPSPHDVPTLTVVSAPDSEDTETARRGAPRPWRHDRSMATRGSSMSPSVNSLPGTPAMRGQVHELPMSQPSSSFLAKPNTRVSTASSSDIKATRSLSMKTLLQLSRLESSDDVKAASPSRASSSGQHSRRSRSPPPDVTELPLLLHVDINKTVTMSDTVMNKSVEYTIRECVAGAFWGTIKYPETERRTTSTSRANSSPFVQTSGEDSPQRPTNRLRYGRDFLEKPAASRTTSSLGIQRCSTQVSCMVNMSKTEEPRWMWDGTKPRQRPEGDYVSYLQFCRQVLPDKEAQRSSIRSFDLVQHLQCRKMMEELSRKTVENMTMPHKCRGADATAAGLSGDWLNIFPSFFELVTSLQESGRTFAILFRSFGNDLSRVQCEWNAFCEGRHPVYGDLLKNIGPMDGSQPNVPDRRIHIKDAHTLYRDAVSPILALGVVTNGMFEGAWDQWGRSKAEEDTRDGRAFLRGLTDTVEGYVDVCAWMRSLALSCRSAAIKDDFAWWHHSGEVSSAGKLMFIVRDITQVFFDDNAGEGKHFNDAKIVDCRYGDPPRTITHALGDGAMYAQVSPIDAIMHKPYFIELLEKCERNQKHCWAKINSAVQHLAESHVGLFQQTSISSDPQSTTPPPMMISKIQSSASGGTSAIALAFRGLPTDELMGNELEVHSVAGLADLLTSHGVNLSEFGTKQYKTLSALFHEVETGRCFLEACTKPEDGENGMTSSCLRRVLQVVLVKVYFRDKILVETHEQMTDGRLRSRNGFLPGAKKRKNEKLEDCVRRWMTDEVQFDPDLLCAVEERGSFEEYDEEVSLSYPLRCRYYRYTVCYMLDEDSMDDEVMERMGLPAGTMFSTTETKRDGTSSTATTKLLHVVHFWSWYQTACWNASQRNPQLSSFPDMMECFDIVLGGNPRRLPYQRLLLQMFQTMAMSKLTGGLSGSLVLKVQPIDADTKRRLDPCIVKLDKADSISREVVNSKRVYKVLSDRAARILSNALFFTDPETNMEYGAFKLELAAGCWQIPEVASSVLEDLLSTMRDLVVYDCESQHPSISDDVPQTPTLTSVRPVDSDCRRPFGNTDAVIYELMGPGGMLRNMQQEGLLRSADTLLDSFEHGMLGKDTAYNPFFTPPGPGLTTHGTSPSHAQPPSSVGQRMRPLLTAFAQKHFAAHELPDVRANVLQLIEDWKKKQDAYTPLIGLAHGDLNMRNVLIDAMDAVWLIDFAFSRDLPLCWDLAKVEISFLFENSVLPVSPATLLLFAGESREEWEASKAADWFDVEQDVMLALLDTLRRATTAASVIDLDAACAEAAQATTRSSPLHTLRKLRARLCHEEEEADVFQFVAELVPNLLEGEILPDLLTDAPKRVLLMEDNVPHKSCVAPLAHLVRHVMRFRRLFMEHWARVVQKYRDDRQQRVSREGGWDAESRVVTGDISAVQLWVALLQESHRLLGYFDIPPWHKTWVVFFVQKLVDLIRAQVLASPSDGAQDSIDFVGYLDSDSTFAGLEQSSELARGYCVLYMDSASVAHLIAAKETMRARPGLAASTDGVPRLPKQKERYTTDVHRQHTQSRVRHVHWRAARPYGSFTINGDGDLCEVAPQANCDSRAICCPHGTRVRLQVVDDVLEHTAHNTACKDPAWRSGVVIDVHADGLYTVLYDTNVDLVHTASDVQHPSCWSDAEWGDRVLFDPQLHNHLICPSVHYELDTELLFYKMCGRAVHVVVVDVYKHLHCVRVKAPRRASQEFKRRRSSASTNFSSSNYPSSDYWVALLPENHCRALMPYANFEEQLMKYRMFKKARFSSTVDVISGETIDVLGSVTFDIARVLDATTLGPFHHGGRGCPPTDAGAGSVDPCTLWCLGGARTRRPSWDDDDKRRATPCMEKQEDWTLLCDFIMNPRDPIVRGHLLFGVPGSGKSCIVRKLIMYCLNRSKQAVPLFIRPSDIARRTAALPPGGLGALSGTRLISWYMELIHGENSPQYSILQQAMSAHRVVFFIDGIDEAGEDLRPALFSCLEALVALDHRVVVTGRQAADMQLVRDHLDVGLLTAWAIQPLSSHAKFELVKSRLRAPHWTEDDARTCLAFASTFIGRLDVTERTKWHIPMMLSVLILYWREKVKTVKKNASSADCQIAAASSRRRISSVDFSKTRDPLLTMAADSSPSRSGVQVQGFEYDIREVYRVALDALLKRAHGTNQADRHAVAAQVEEFKALMGCIAWDMHNERRNAFTEGDALRAEDNIFDDAAAETSVWYGLKRLIHKGHVPLLQYDHTKPHGQTYCFAFHSFSEFLAREWEERRVLMETQCSEDTIGRLFAQNSSEMNGNPPVQESPLKSALRYVWSIFS